jgi:hypothetical protein
VAQGSAFPRWPSFLPDGRHFLYVGGPLRADAAAIGILVGSIVPGFEARAVAAGDGNALFAAPGVLLFMRGERLMQQPFDPDRLELSGDATPVVEDVFYNPGVGRADFTVSKQWRPGVQIRLQARQPVRMVRSCRDVARNRGSSWQLPHAGPVSRWPAAGLQ